MKAPVPETRLARAGIAGATALKMGVSQLRHKSKRPFMSEQERETEKTILDDKNAQLLFTALTQLRGTALKLAQMLGMELDILPDRYRKELKKSFHKVPPLNRVLVRKVTQEEFAQTPETLFKQFDSSAFAAASSGQVHAALLPDGNDPADANLIIHGTAEISSDPALCRKYWKPACRLFFPESPNSYDLVVIRIKPKRIELMDFKRNIIPEPFGLKPLVLE